MIPDPELDDPGTPLADVDERDLNTIPSEDIP